MTNSLIQHTTLSSLNNQTLSQKLLHLTMSPLAINWTVLAEIENKKYFTSVIKVVRGIAHFYSKGKKEITREDLNEFVQNTYGKSESMHLILHTNIVCKEFGFGVDHPEGHPCLLGPKTGDKDKTHKGHGKHLICKGKISGRKEFVYINEEFCDKLFIKNGQDITTDQVSKKELELKTKNEKVSKRKRDSDSEEDDEPNSKKAEIEIQNVQNIPIMNQDEILKPISEPIQTVQEVQLQSFSSMSGYDLGDMPLFDEPSITYPVEHSLEEMQDLAQQLNPFYELAQMEDQAIETQQILSIKDSNVDMNNIDMNNIDMDNLDRMFKTEEFKSDPEQINSLLGNDVKRENNGNKSQGKQQQKMRIDNLPSFG